MKIDMSKGYFSFQLEESELTFACVTNGITQAKELYLQHISEQIDNEIDSKVNKLAKIEKDLI